jgi:transcriptional regulator with XRE-family HTH domain
MENTNGSFGKLIRHLRESKNMSLDNLAAITTLSKAYLSRLENEERRNPTIFVINKLTSALDLDIKIVEELFADGDDKQVDKTVQTIDSVLLNSIYMFAGKVATIEVKLSLRDIIKSLEKYSAKETLNRDDEFNLLQLADKLREV